MTGLLKIPNNVNPETFRRVLAGATAAYSILKKTPTVDQIAGYCACRPASINKVIVTPEFKALMSARGFPWHHAKLSPTQIYAVQILTNPTNRLPLARKLKMAGVSYATYRAWLKQPAFAEYITKISEDMLGEHVADVHTRVLEKATNGDIQAIKLYYELTGRHDPQKQQMVDLNGVIGLLLEVITRYVPDAVALGKITADIDLILSGGTPKALEQFDVNRIASGVGAIDAEVIEDDDQPIFDLML